VSDSLTPIVIDDSELETLALGGAVVQGETTLAGSDLSTEQLSLLASGQEIVRFDLGLIIRPACASALAA
jgi:hypothetical protein